MYMSSLSTIMQKKKDGDWVLSRTRAPHASNPTPKSVQLPICCVLLDSYSAPATASSTHRFNNEERLLQESPNRR